jgi:CDP-glycerol glycerophosphotransferase (TagB/SpsB family)
MSKVKQLFLLCINLFLYGISHLIPKKPDLWVFGAWFGSRYSDNSKAFFDYINQHQKHITAIWISKDQTVVQSVRNKGYRAYHANSLVGLWCQCRAKFAFVCQALQDDLYAPCISKQTIVVNLWHGLPLKKIMYDVFGEKVVQKNFIGRLFDYLSPYEKQRNDYLLATSPETQQTLSKAFRLPIERTLITGFPRNDVFLNLPVKAENTAFKCIYMPTFRGGQGSECDLFAQYGFDVNAIDTVLVENNIALVLRMHPVNKPPQALIEKIQHSRNIKIDNSADIFDSICLYDCMVTDYSGGYFDFLLSNKPILFAPFDLAKYKAQERDLYYEYEDVTLGPYAYSWSELIAIIVSTKKKEYDNDDYIKSYEMLKQKFHQPLNTEKSFSGKLFSVLSDL